MELKKAEKRHKLTTRDYAQLAEFRQALRGFLRFSDSAAAKAGLSTRHYQVMLILRASTEDEKVTIAMLAKKLFVKHNSAVGLVDRLEQVGLVVREPSRDDRRKVELRLTPRGRDVLARLAAMHREELRRIGPLMRRFFGAISKSALG